MPMLKQIAEAPRSLRLTISDSGPARTRSNF